MKSFFFRHSHTSWRTVFILNCCSYLCSFIFSLLIDFLKIFWHFAITCVLLFFFLFLCHSLCFQFSLFVSFNKVFLLSRCNLTLFSWNRSFLDNLFLILKFVFFIKSYFLLIVWILSNDRFSSWRLIWCLWLFICECVDIFIRFRMISNNHCSFHRRTIFDEMFDTLCSDGRFLFSRKRFMFCQTLLFLHKLVVISLIIMTLKFQACLCQLWFHILKLVKFEWFS